MRKSPGRRTPASARTAAAGQRPLSALLTQVLVAFTIELDNAFELQMAACGHPGARVSLVIWLTVMRFLSDGHGANGAMTVAELTSRGGTSPERTRLVLGCLERWGLVSLGPAATGRTAALSRGTEKRRPHRAGFGSGRGIRLDWRVSLTPMGDTAAAIWKPLPALVEHGWRTRFGRAAIAALREPLEAILGQLEVELPQGLSGGWRASALEEFPARADGQPADRPLPVLLAQALILFRMEFNREAPAPLSLSANLLRVLSATPVREADLPSLTGASPETGGLGWQVKRYVRVAQDPAAGRGKVVSLSPEGLQAQRTYRRLVGEIERRWEGRYGAGSVRSLRTALAGLFARDEQDRPLLMQGLRPPPGVVRSGAEVPALGRTDVGAAARKRARDLAAQTAAFVQDPAGSLPHYPLWDMNRGFGP